MPRLILIEGPQSGNFFRLGQQNFLGWANGSLSFSYTDNILQKQLVIRSAGPNFELLNIGQTEPIQVNGAAVQHTFLQHGDLISMRDSLMIFDADESASESSQHPGLGALQQAVRPSDSVRISALPPGEESDNLFGTISIRRDQADKADHDKINHRQKHFSDHDQILKGIQDGRRIATLFNISSKISTIHDLNELLNALLDVIFEELPADRGSILLFDSSQRRLRTMAKKLRHGNPDDKVKISRSIVKEVLRTKESILTIDAQSDQRINMALSIVDQGIRSALCVPLVWNEKILGIIHLDTTEQVRAFAREDLEMMTAVAMQAALAIENARLIKEMAEKERMKYELNLASTIQRQLLPKKLPKTNDIEVYGKMIPAKELGGDYFDFMQHDEKRMHICIGDVSGKGVPAGLVMVMARSHFRALTKASHDWPANKILGEANRLLHADTKREMFMSALLLEWNEDEGKLRWSGAGHEHLIIYRAKTRRSEAIRAGGIALGLVPDIEERLEEHVLELEPGDAVLLYTDGITEAKNPQGNFFAANDLGPVLRLVDLYGYLSAKELLEAVLWDLKTFIGGAEQADDITVVTLKRRTDGAVASASGAVATMAPPPAGEPGVAPGPTPGVPYDPATGRHRAPSTVQPPSDTGRHQRPPSGSFGEVPPSSSPSSGDHLPPSSG